MRQRSNQLGLAGLSPFRDRALIQNGTLAYYPSWNVAAERVPPSELSVQTRILSGWTSTYLLIHWISMMTLHRGGLPHHGQSAKPHACWIAAVFLATRRSAFCERPARKTSLKPHS